MHADRGHVHHRLIDMGFSQKQAVAISYLLSAILGLSAVVLTDRGEIQALIFLAAVVVVGAIGVGLIFGKRHQLKESESDSLPQSDESEQTRDTQREEPHDEN